MPDNVIVNVDIPEEKLEAMQKAADDLIAAVSFILPKRGEMPVDQYDAMVQHTIFGNCVVRICISMSNNLGALDLRAINSAAITALGYIAEIAEPAFDTNPGERPSTH